MSEIERRRINVNRDDSDGAPDGANDQGAGLESARQAGDDLLQAGDSIIRGLMSGDSVAYLRSSRQTGGQ